MSAWSQSQRRSYGWSIVLLIGHLICTALAFVVALTLGWLVSWALTYLDSVHKFPVDIYTLGARLEVALFYADVGACVLVLILGFVCFVKDALEKSL